MSSPDTPAHSAAPSPDPRQAREHQLKVALNAFKKRYKLTKLDHESKLGGARPTTTGKSSNMAGIIPPREFPRDVWEELSKQGKIKDLGGGFYGMV